MQFNFENAKDNINKYTKKAALAKMMQAALLVPAAGQVPKQKENLSPEHVKTEQFEEQKTEVTATPLFESKDTNN